MQNNPSRFRRQSNSDRTLVQICGRLCKIPGGCSHDSFSTACAMPHSHLSFFYPFNRGGAATCYSEALRRRSALAMTETELKLIAALASIGLSSQPKMG